MKKEEKKEGRVEGVGEGTKKEKKAGHFLG